MGQVFPDLLNPKYVLIEMYKKACFWKLFGSERVN